MRLLGVSSLSVTKVYRCASSHPSSQSSRTNRFHKSSRIPWNIFIAIAAFCSLEVHHSWIDEYQKVEKALQWKEYMRQNIESWANIFHTCQSHHTDDNRKWIGQKVRHGVRKGLIHDSSFCSLVIVRSDTCVAISKIPSRKPSWWFEKGYYFWLWNFECSFRPELQHLRHQPRRQ